MHQLAADERDVINVEDNSSLPRPTKKISNVARNYCSRLSRFKPARLFDKLPRGSMLIPAYDKEVVLKRIQNRPFAKLFFPSRDVWSVSCERCTTSPALN